MVEKILFPISLHARKDINYVGLNREAVPIGIFYLNLEIDPILLTKIYILIFENALYIGDVHF
jgi:hypothetical protein